jgi:hypothetical protein
MTNVHTRRHVITRLRAAMVVVGLAAATAGAAAGPASAQAAPPSIRLVTPGQGGTLVPGTVITPSVSSGIFRVEYTLTAPGAYSSISYLLGASTAPPFTLTWQGVPSGLIGAADLRSWRLVATGFDSSGAIVHSDAPVNGIQVRPTVSPRVMGFGPTVTGGAVNAGVLGSGQVSVPVTRFPAAGASATYSLSAPSAGTYDLHIARGELSSTGGTLRVTVNGVVVADAAGFATSPTRKAPDVRDVVSIRVPLNARANTVTLTAVGGAGPTILNVYAAAAR